MAKSATPTGDGTEMTKTGLAPPGFEFSSAFFAFPSVPFPVFH
jgi:hypothetical protein